MNKEQAKSLQFEFKKQLEQAESAGHYASDSGNVVAYDSEEHVNRVRALEYIVGALGRFRSTVSPPTRDDVIASLEKHREIWPHPVWNEAIEKIKQC